MKYESPEIVQVREKKRAAFSLRVGELLHSLSPMTPAHRLAWHTKSCGHFFFEQGDRSERIRAINHLAAEHKSQVIEAADRVLRHEFDILGSGFVNLGKNIEWTRDFKAGFSWRNDVLYPTWNWRKVDDLADEEFFRGPFVTIDDPSDVKMPWDLCSFFHFPALGEAFLQTADRRYADELLDELRDWHEKNPYPRGVNWTCAMHVAIRLANLIYGLRMIDGMDFFAEVGLLSILRHLKFILDFMEVDQDGRRNNHYLNNLVGLCFGGAEIAGSALGCDLLDFAAEELNRELLTQFSADGTNYEGSLPYHRFALESCITAGILLERNGRPLLPPARAHLKRILQFIDFYTKPNGLAPQFGDNDNGRILVLHNYLKQEYRDHRHILAVGAAWLGMKELITNIADQAPDVIWLLGQSGSRTTPREVPFVGGLYNSNGWVLAKTAHSSFLVRCGLINAQSGGGHNHCDQLSIEYHDQGQDLIVDPGAMIYSGNAGLRNQYRSTAAHNVLQLDDREQHQFIPNELFAMQDRARAAIDAWEIENDSFYFRGHHLAYQDAGWKVSREIHGDFSKGRLDLRDMVELIAATSEGREFCGRLHLAVGVSVEQTDDLTCSLLAGNQQWTLHFSEGLRIIQAQGLVSPGYGVWTSDAILEYRFAATGYRVAHLLLERANG